MTQKAKHLWRWLKSSSHNLASAAEPGHKSNHGKIGFFSEQERARARLERMKRSYEQRLPLL